MENWSFFDWAAGAFSTLTVAGFLALCRVAYSDSVKFDRLVKPAAASVGYVWGLVLAALVFMHFVVAWDLERQVVRSQERFADCTFGPEHCWEAYGHPQSTLLESAGDVAQARRRIAIWAGIGVLIVVAFGIATGISQTVHAEHYEVKKKEKEAAESD